MTACDADGAREGDGAEAKAKASIDAEISSEKALETAIAAMERR